jgi:hypothetical protein
MLLSKSASNYAESKSVAFVYEDKNYLIKMKTDLDFLQETAFANMFNFSTKNDPMLIYPSNKKTTNTKQMIPIQNKLMKHIRRCEWIILEEKIVDRDELRRIAMGKVDAKIGVELGKGFNTKVGL